MRDPSAALEGRGVVYFGNDWNAENRTSSHHIAIRLARLSHEQYGLDVSPAAIERARVRLPQAHFAAVDLFQQPWGEERHRFDLVTACEVLYYLSDPAATVARMRHLGRCGLVTFFAPACGRVGPHVEAIPGLQKTWIHHGGTAWLIGWWRDA